MSTSDLNAVFAVTSCPVFFPHFSILETLDFPPMSQEMCFVFSDYVFTRLCVGFGNLDLALVYLVSCL